MQVGGLLSGVLACFAWLSVCLLSHLLARLRGHLRAYFAYVLQACFCCPCNCSVARSLACFRSVLARMLVYLLCPSAFRLVFLPVYCVRACLLTASFVSHYQVARMSLGLDSGIGLDVQ